jgi:hypothetical protein
MGTREIKDRYARSFARGDFPSLEELIEEHPEYAGEITEFCLGFWPFANHMKAQLEETLLWYVDDRHSEDRSEA